MDETTFSHQTSVLRNANWTMIPGNYQEFTYYGGATPENPSGNPNIQKIESYNGYSKLKLTETFHWNGSDDIIKIIAS